MNFAKKTMSLALASVMAASSLFVGSTAFAATDKVIKPMTGNTQAVTATVKDTINKYGYHDYDVDSSVYAYTPAKTGYYAVSVKSTPVYEKETTKTYTEDGTTYTNKDYEYSYTNSAQFSKRVDDASVTVYDNNNLRMFFLTHKRMKIHILRMPPQNTLTVTMLLSLTQAKHTILMFTLLLIQTLLPILQHMNAHSFQVPQ